MRARFLALFLGLTLGASGATPRPNVVLVTLDTTRADRMGFLGSTRGLTPALDALARESVVFTRAYSQAPITTVSHATILTGTYPPTHHVVDFGSSLDASVPYLPDLLRREGYHTAAFVGSLVLDPSNGTAPGFDRGFGLYDAGFRLRWPGEDRYQTLERRGDEVVARAMRWMASAGPDPFFLWVHLNDPHDPYDPPGDLKKRFASTPYDGEIAALDRFVANIVDALRSRLESTVLVVAGDHGEALGDHGESTHGVFLYDATLHVPLLVRLPARRGASVRVTTRVRLADVAPTIVDALGLRTPPSMEGQSMLPLIAAPRSDDRPVYAESDYPRRAFGWSSLVSWRADRFLWIRAPRPELYDSTADPSQSTNLVERRGRVADQMNTELGEFMRRSRSSTRAPGAVDPALTERLAALGYVGGSGGGGAQPGVDPKDRIAIANTLHEAVLLVDDGVFGRAIPLLERVVASEPNIELAQLELGVARVRQREYAKALAPLRQAIALQPDTMTAHYELGLALYETGDLRTSARHFEIVAARMPNWADARYSLGSVYARIDRVGDATTELRAALALDPKHFRANLLLGRILTLSGEPHTALAYLQTAADVQPTNSEAHQFLADAYEKAGDAQAAAKEREHAQKLKSKPG